MAFLYLRSAKFFVALQTLPPSSAFSLLQLLFLFVFLLDFTIAVIPVTSWPWPCRWLQMWNLLVLCAPQDLLVKHHRGYIRTSGSASSHIRYGLVARISRSHTVFSVTQLGPRRPGFNSPCRNFLLLVDRTTRLFCAFRRFLSTMWPRKMILFVIIIEDEICGMELFIV
jgi:hypothetical protein